MTDLQASPSGLPRDPISQQKLDISEAARATWRVFRRRPGPFIGLLFVPVLATLPVQVLTALIQIPMRSALGRNSGTAIAIAILLSIVTLVVQYGAQFTCQLAALWGAARRMEGLDFIFGEALRVGFRRLLPYVGLIILTVAIVLIGLILLVVPGIIAAGFLAVASSACVVERCGPIESIKRSFFLIRGNWWRSFGVVLLTLFLPLLAFGVACLAVYLICAAIGEEWLALIMILPAIPFFVVFVAIASIVPAVLFVELRALKEGRVQGGVAEVFE